MTPFDRIVHIYRGSSYIWRILAQDCRTQKPLVPTSKALDLTIDRVIDDIESGRDIRDFVKLKDPFQVRRANGLGCSSVLMEFLLLLRHHMALQGTVDVSAIRATELLFDFAAAKGLHRRALRIVEEAPGVFSFVTTYAAEEKYKESHRYLLPVRHDVLDWQALETKRDAPVVPYLTGS